MAENTNTEREASDASAILSKICDLFQIGKMARTESTILVNVKNVIDHARLLHAVERDLFPQPELPEDDDPYATVGDELPAPNSWAAKDEADYVAQFRAALAARASLSLPAAIPEGISRDDTVHGETYFTAEDMATAEARGFRAGRASLSLPAAGQEPVFWVRLCSDGLYEGPIHNARIEEVRRQSGAWSPLYLGAAPQPAVAAVETQSARSVIEHCEPMSPTEIYADGRADQYEQDLNVIRRLLENCDDEDSIGDGRINTSRVRELLADLLPPAPSTEGA